MATTWTVTLRAGAEATPLGLGLCPDSGTITLIDGGLFAKFNHEVERGSELELGDRIIEVDGKSGNVHDLLSARLQEGRLTGDLTLKLRRPRLIQPVVVQLQPGEQLGLDVDVASTNIIQNIDSGLVADLNKVYPGSVEAGDRILKVDGQVGNAVEAIRAWAKDHADSAGELTFEISRSASQVKEMPSAAWSFSVLVRVQPGESLGAILDTSTNAIAEIEATGAVPKLCAAHPHALAVGDRLLTVDGVPCPQASSAAELEAWFQGRKPFKDIPRDLRLQVLRPAELAADVTVLPPYEYRLDSKGNARRLESKSTTDGLDEKISPRTPETEDSSGPKVLFADASGEKLPNATTLATPVSLEKFVEGTEFRAPERRWYQIFNASCCETVSYPDTNEQQVKGMLAEAA